MYSWILRPILFLFPPEFIHACSVFFVKLIAIIPFCGSFVRKLCTVRSDLLEKEVMGLKFPNPVGFAAGFDKNAEFFNEFSVFGFGFIEIGTVTPRPQPGNPKPRLFRLTADKALINRMGFNNKGVDHAVNQLKKTKKKLIIGGNIGKNTLTIEENVVEDYVYCFQQLYDHVDYFVVNVSCPNIGDISRLQDQETVERILRRLSEIRGLKPIRKPVLLKISPDLNYRQIDETISIIQKHSMDGIVAVNTTISRDGLITSGKMIKKAGDGGLSGAPLKARSNEIIRYIKTKTGGNLPVIASGGVMSVQDAIEKLESGADLIQVYTGFIYEGPAFVRKINKKLLEREKHKLKIVNADH